jgi:hypothetical protein
MRNRLATAALIALFGLTGDVIHPAAQLARAESVPPEALTPIELQLAHRFGTAKMAVRRRVKPHSKQNVNVRKIAERHGYKQVIELVNFPRFFPGLGIVFVKPDSLPLGPFLCFDRQDRLMATVYMVPTKDIDDHKAMEAPGFAGPVDHVSLYFNPGHAGVDVPHYHFVIWHVTKKQETRVAK